jgi:hypothetical protein
VAAATSASSPHSSTRLFPVGPEILGGAIAWSADDSKKVLEAYRDFSASAPRELTSVAVLRIAPAPWLPKEVHGKPIVAIFRLPFRSGGARARPHGKQLRAVGLPGGRHRAAPPLLTDAEPARRNATQGAALLLEVALRPPSTRALSTLPSSTRAAESPHSAILMFQVDGALNDLPADHSPAGNRDAKYNAEHHRLLGTPETTTPTSAGRATFEAARAPPRPAAST